MKLIIWKISYTTLMVSMYLFGRTVEWYINDVFTNLKMNIKIINGTTNSYYLNFAKQLYCNMGNKKVYNYIKLFLINSIMLICITEQ